MPDPIGGVQPFAELARGRTNTVYKGYQRDPGRFVLLKTVRPEEADDELIERFEAEARIAAQVRHPNVVEVYGAGRDGATAYLLTEFVEGLDVRALVERGPVPPPLAALVLAEAAQGLAAVHAAGILHRDLKPANLLVSTDGAVKLTDFGLASLTSAGGAEMRGTLAYLAPEIVRGEPPTEASDLFSLGAILAELLTGRASFARENDGDTLDAVLHHDPVPPLAEDPRVPPALADLAAALLAKAPSQRLSDARHLVEELDTVLVRHPAEAADLAAFLRAPASYTPRPVALPTEPVAPEVTPRRSRRRTAWAVALVMLAALGYAGITLAPEQSDSVPPDTLLQAPLGVVPTDSVSGDEALIVSDALPVEEPREAVDAALDDRAAPILQTEAGTEPPPLPERDSASTPEPMLPADPALAPPTTGTLTVAAEPWARIRIDDEPVGTTPLAALTLPAGRHRITFENPEFPVHVVSVEVEAGGEERVAVSLWDLVGRVSLVVSPWAEVRVNGTVWDTVPPQERPLILTPGEHRLAFVHPSLGTREMSLRVAAGESRTLSINLTEDLP